MELHMLTTLKWLTLCVSLVSNLKCHAAQVVMSSFLSPALEITDAWIIMCKYGAVYHVSIVQQMALQNVENQSCCLLHPMWMHNIICAYKILYTFETLIHRYILFIPWCLNPQHRQCRNISVMYGSILSIQCPWMDITWTWLETTGQLTLIPSKWTALWGPREYRD